MVTSMPQLFVVAALLLCCCSTWGVQGLILTAGAPAVAGKAPSQALSVKCWLDLRYCILPAHEEMQRLYVDMRARKLEAEKGDDPDAPDAVEPKMNNPVSGLLFPAGRGEEAQSFAEKSDAGDAGTGAAALSFFMMNEDSSRVIKVLPTATAAQAWNKEGGDYGVVVTPDVESPDPFNIAQLGKTFAAGSRTAPSKLMIDDIKPSQWTGLNAGLEMSTQVAFASGASLVMKVNDLQQLSESVNMAYRIGLMGGADILRSPEEGEGPAKVAFPDRPPEIILLLEASAKLWEAAMLYMEDDGGDSEDTGSAQTNIDSEFYV